MDSNKIDSILFVCLGNICRSPLAEAIAKDIAQKKDLKITIDSAGTGSWHIGEPPCTNSQKIAKQKGLDISSYRARQVNKKDFQNFSLVIGLDHSNVSNLKKMGCKNPLLLGSFGYNNEDVPDPYFFDGFQESKAFEGFEKVYYMIEVCITSLITQTFEV